tara:strand:+ start:19603 stop:20025 length:423 start_codon:yes stop_codon:yes gene_type:complete
MPRKKMPAPMRTVKKIDRLLETMVEEYDMDTDVRDDVVRAYVDRGWIAILFADGTWTVSYDRLGARPSYDGYLAGKYTTYIYDLVRAMEKLELITEDEFTVFHKWFDRAKEKYSRKTELRRLEQTAHDLGYKLVKREKVQ